jgi:hypothetical protein
MKPSRVILLVIGVLTVLVGASLAAGGTVLGVVAATQRDSEGFFTTSNERFETSTAAITTEEIDLGRPGPEHWWSNRDLATVRLRVDSAKDGAIFVGIAREADVERYLRGVPHDEVADIGFEPFTVDYRPENVGGRRAPSAPADQSFWAAQASGESEQTLSWDVEPGRWAIVVMNADGARGVSADVEVGGRLDFVVGIAVALLVVGLVALLLGVLMIVLAVRPASAAQPAARLGSDESALSRTTYPVSLTGRLDPTLSRWQWLVKWVLAIPHFIILIGLWVAFAVLTFVAFFAILFTGRYPRSLFDFNVGVMRWSWRVAFYCTSVLGTDQYPPFSLSRRDDYPASLDVAYPEHLSRGLVLVKSWLLAIPHLIIVGMLSATWVVGGAAESWQGPMGGGLLGLLVIVAAVVLLVSGTYPQGLFDLLVGLNRWIYRVIAYVALMTDEYPPFHLDQGPDEPPAAPLPPPPSPLQGEETAQVHEMAGR